MTDEVAKSTCGCSAARMPNAMYSWRTMSQYSRMRSGLRSAIIPSCSGHLEKHSEDIEASTFVEKA